MTQQQLNQARIEQEYNAISDTIITYMPFGTFYGAMQSVSKLGESFINKKVCIDQSGNLITTYKTTSGKVLAAYLKPQHELINEQLAKKKWGKAIVASMPIFGQTQRVKEQQKLEKQSKCFNMTIKEFIDEKNRRDLEEQRKLQESKSNQKKEISKTTIILLISSLLVISAGILYIKSKNK